MDSIFVGIQEYLTKVHQMQFSKNSYIKPHIDNHNMDGSLIAWLQKEILKEDVLVYFNNV